MNKEKQIWMMSAVQQVLTMITTAAHDGEDDEGSYGELELIFGNHYRTERNRGDNQSQFMFFPIGSQNFLKSRFSSVRI